MAYSVRLLGTFVGRGGVRMVCLMGGHLGMRSDDRLHNDWGKEFSFLLLNGNFCVNRNAMN